MFELVSFEKFRDTPSVQFFDITVPKSNARDLVFHDGPAISPHNAATGDWQFYLHPRQEDNLLALSGGRTFYLVNFHWDYPFHRVRLDQNAKILRIPPGTFHRSVSDSQGSLVINQAVRHASATIQSEFHIYNSAELPKLKALLASGLPPVDHGFPDQREIDQVPMAA
ncbi:MAG: redox protein [Symploca sp. SIO2G7]|nr:redox protein [Symploca sp. SIO2G7]